MRRLISLLRTSATFAILVALYAVARWWSTTGHSPARFPDSLGYHTVRFFGVNERLWAVPFVYSFMHSDPQRVMLQVMVGVVAWAYLAWVLAAVTRFHATAMVVVFLVGLAPQVIRYDLAILSESLGISFSVFAIAASIHLTRSRSRLVGAAWLISVVLVSFTRPTHLVVIFLIAGYSLSVYLFSRRQRRNTAAITFGLLSVWAVMQLRGNQSESTLNFYTLLQKRICVDAEQYTWFTTHGMPDIPGLCAARGYAYAFEMKNTVGEILQLPEGQQPLQTMVVGDIAMATWVRDHAWSVYTQYILSHPSSITSALQHNASHTLDTASQEFLPTNARTVLPFQILNPWWLWFAVGAAAATVAAFTTRNKRILRTLCITAVFVFIVYVSSLLASAVELQRHAATASVLLRVLTLSFVALATGKSAPITPDESFGERGASYSRGTSPT